MANTTKASLSNFIEINTSTCLPIKLTSNNYPTWYKQITKLLDVHDLLGYVIGDTPCPPSKIGTGAAATDNPAFSLWKHQDNYVFLALLGSYGLDA